MKRVTILDIPFDAMKQAELMETLDRYLTEPRAHLIMTPNPEAIMRSKRDAPYKKILQSADLSLPDGIGVIIASRLLKNPIPNRLCGCDTAFALMARIQNSPYTAYLLGAAPGVAETARQNLIKKYPGLRITGVHDGFFDNAEEKKILAELETLQPDILIIGMGMPKQEVWAAEHRDLPVKLVLCLGGTIDIMAGTVKRAPVFFQKLGLEWFYRLVKEPSRAKRMLDLPRFMLAVLKCKKLSSH